MRSLKLGQTKEAGSVLINETRNILITVIAATAVISGDISLGAMLAVQYVAEALEEEQEIIVRSVELTQTGTQGRLNASLEWQGETLTVELDLPRVWS